MEWNELIETGMKLIQMGCNNQIGNEGGNSCKDYCPFYNYCCEPGTKVDPTEWEFKK